MRKAQSHCVTCNESHLMTQAADVIESSHIGSWTAVVYYGDLYKALLGLRVFCASSNGKVISLALHCWKEP